MGLAQLVSGVFLQLLLDIRWHLASDLIKLTSAPSNFPLISDCTNFDTDVIFSIFTAQTDFEVCFYACIFIDAVKKLLNMLQKYSEFHLKNSFNH